MQNLTDLRRRLDSAKRKSRELVEQSLALIADSSGEGLRLDPDASADPFRAALARLVAEPAFAENARTLGRAIASAEPPDALAATLEAFVAESRTLRASA